MVGAVLRIFVRTHVSKNRYQAVPKHGPVIIVCNHPSPVDPILVFGALRRRVAFLAMEELFGVPVLGSAMRWMGHIPVARGTDHAMDCLDFAEQVLLHGGVVVIFIEGGCSPDGQIKHPKGGVAELASRTGAVVIPLGINGTRAVKSPDGGRIHLNQPVTLKFGDQGLYAPDDHTLEARTAFTDQMVDQLVDLSGYPRVAS